MDSKSSQYKSDNWADGQTEVYITVLTNDKYVCGVKALKRSLEKVKSKHDLIVLIPKSSERLLQDTLENNGILDEQ